MRFPLSRFRGVDRTRFWNCRGLDSPLARKISGGCCKLLRSLRRPLIGLLQVLGLLQVQRECNATAVERSLAKSDRTRESLDRRARLEMGIENELGHGQDASGLQGVENLA